VCVTGPESTGKSVLAARLAERFHAGLTEECSRRYAAQKGTPLDVTDVLPIARAQGEAEDAAIASVRAAGGTLLVLDTDLLSTVVYARYYYGIAPPELLAAERARRAELYLLCDVDVPWVADGVRDRPDDRVGLHRRFARALARRHAAVVPIAGDWPERRATAEAAVAQLLTGDRSVAR
jgi:NadR type nicotinamide-nucleotide adenylyltransferase